MDITFFEAFGDPETDQECTVLRDGVAEMGISNDTLLNAVSDKALCHINGCDYILTGPENGALWSGMVNPGTKRQREVRFAQLKRADGTPTSVRIVVVKGELVRGEAILDVRTLGGDQALHHAGLVCFTHGCNILTAFGDIPIQNLRVGDLMHTADNGLQPIRWIGAREMTRTKMQVAPQAQPVKIKAGAFGPYLPATDIWVSQQHHMLLETDDAKNMFDLESVLAPAKALVNGTSITVDTQIGDTKYMHLLFDEHQVVFVDGIPSESFFPSPASLMSLMDEDRAEVFELMPNLEGHPLSYGPYARETVPLHKAQMLAA